uniref:Peptidase S1 domain-containing protein n=1 Tax=Cyprinodon variegatus TaxID=28743 RepID=A0A3Q2DZE4_CYPVA
MSWELARSSSAWLCFLGGAAFYTMMHNTLVLCLQGDSGAPLFCRKHGAYFLFGVVTWGSLRCKADKPAIFTGLPDYRSWIDDVTEQ